MIGITGSHRTGKTSLALAFSEKAKVPFIETSTSKLMLAHGFDPSKDYPIEERLEIQHRILVGLEDAYQSHSPLFVTDRTPLDAAAYMLADVQRQNVPDDLHHDIVEYVESCIEVTNRHFAVLMVVQPGIPLKPEPGKAPASPAYIEHIHQLITGLVADERIKARHFYIPRRILDMETRVRALRQAINRTVEHAGVELEAFVLNGGKVH